MGWMTDNHHVHVLSDAAWDSLRPLLEECRPRGKTEPQDLRQTIEAIIWRHDNGAKWRSIPPELGPWHRAAQTFIRWSRLGVWERLLELAKAAGAAKKGALRHSGMSVRRLAALAEGMARRPA